MRAGGSIERTHAAEACPRPRLTARCHFGAGGAVKSHSSTVVSAEPDASVLPSGEKARAVMTERCPGNSYLTRPVASSTTRTIPSLGRYSFGGSGDRVPTAKFGYQFNSVFFAPWGWMV